MLTSAPDAAGPDDGPKIQEVVIVNPFHGSQSTCAEFLGIRSNRTLTAHIIYFFDGHLRVKNDPSQGSLYADSLPEKRRLNIMKADARAKPIAISESPDIEDEIRRRAYQLFEGRGKEVGRELEDWLRAEEEVRGTKTKSTAA